MMNRIDEIIKSCIYDFIIKEERKKRPVFTQLRMFGEEPEMIKATKKLGRKKLTDWEKQERADKAKRDKENKGTKELNDNGFTSNPVFSDDDF